VERLNSEGIPRHQLKFALRRPATVLTARRVDSCLLCRRKGVNEAGLCDLCYPLIQDPEEQGLIEKWLSGEGP
jgi:hypothetical protein